MDEHMDLNGWIGDSSGSGDDFLGVALVDYIHKRLIFDFETMANR